MIFIAYHPCYELELPRGHRFPMDKYPCSKQLIYEIRFQMKTFLPKKLEKILLKKFTTKIMFKNY